MVFSGHLWPRKLLYVVSLHGRLLLRFHQPHEVAGYHYSAIGTVYLYLLVEFVLLSGVGGWEI